MTKRENLITGCHGNAFGRALSKSTNLAKISGHMTIPIKKIKTSKGVPFRYILQKLVLKYLDSNQNDSCRSEKLIQLKFMYLLFDLLYLT